MVGIMHALIAPSDASIWAFCPGSIKMRAGLVDDRQDHLEGSALHEVARTVLNCSGTLHDIEGMPVTIEGGHVVIITRGMINRVIVYIDFCKRFRFDRDLDDHYDRPHIEECVEAPRIHKECFGTPDFWKFDQEKKLLTIVDYKDGWGEISPYRNFQLICYVAGIVEKYFRIHESNMKVNFVIVQPRTKEVSPIKQWLTSAVNLRAEINLLSNSAYQALSNDPSCTAGKHCKYCLAKFKCESFNTTVDDMVTTVVHSENNGSYNLSNRLKFLKVAGDMIKQSISMEEAKAVHTIQRGGTVGGFTLGTGRPTKKWNNVPGLEAVADLLGVSVKKTNARITPLQSIEAGIPESMLKPYIETVPGKVKLIPTSLDDARKIFGDK